MSSVTRFLRQIPTGLSTYSADVNNLYVFQPTGGNYVGNYPPGYMRKVPSGVVGGSTDRLVRDMGKTIFASISANGTGTDLTGIGPGFFRAVQIINPVVVDTPTSVTNFGVQGSVPGSLPASNPGDMGFNTFYVPIVVGGVIAENSSAVTGSAQTPVSFGGQL